MWMRLQSWVRNAGLKRPMSLALVAAVMTTAPAAAQQSHLIVVSGLGGTDEYRDRFYEWSSRLVDAAIERHGIPADQVIYLTERPDRDPERIHAHSTWENVQAAIADVAGRAAAGDVVLIVLIGHGSFSGSASRYNLPGPDPTVADFAVALEALAAQRVAFINTASASGEFIAGLSGENRTIITATKTARERNETKFGGFFVDAIAGRAVPTGSGKTTTLYSALDLLRSPERNIVTVEDPVEYQLDLINQIQVHEAIGVTFARALRSILRQDPDIIMVGEIRDEETARVAVQAALTGHLVLATLHTNDAPGAVARLLDMGIEPYLLSSAINGAVAQRLVRTICSGCETKYYPSEQVLADAELSEQTGLAFTRGSGCQQCHNSGFRGRAGIYEVMEVTPAIRRMVHLAAPSYEFRAALRQLGVMTLRQEGVQLAMRGKSSLEEVLGSTHVGGAEDSGEHPDRRFTRQSKTKRYIA